MNWYYSKNGQQVGPVSDFDIQAKAKSGEILPTDLVWKEGMPDWKPLSQMPELLGGGSAVIPAAQNPGGGQIPLPQPTAYTSRNTHPHIPNYLWQSIVVTVLCCLPFGVVGIVYASKVDSLVAMGNYEAAYSASKTAKTWTMVGFFSWLGLALLYLLIFVGALASGV